MTATDPKRPLSPRLQTQTVIEIDTTPIRYLSANDEDHFFSWAKGIKCVESVNRGILRIEREKVSDEDLRELLALLTRYSLSVDPLRKLVSRSNDHWFNDPRAYWNAN